MGRTAFAVVAALLTAHLAHAAQAIPRVTTAPDAQDLPRTDGWVVLSVEDYRTLRTRAFASAPEPPPPVDAALTRIDYDLRLAGDTVTGDARLTIDVLKQGWVSVLVPPGVLVRDARLDGRPTAIVDGDPPRVLIARPGRSSLTLGLVVPLTASAGTESIVLPPSGSALSAVSLVIPRTGVDLSVSGGLVVDHTESATETRWTIYGRPGGALTFSWKRKADDHRATLPLKTRARITELVALGEDSTQVSTSVHLEVSQGLARQAVLQLPPGLVVNQVAGATVADWNADATGLTVTFLEPIATDTSFLVTGETRAPREGAVVIPIVRIPAAERETGGIAVDVVGPGEINERQPRNMEPADAVRSRRHHRGPRIAVDGRVPVRAARCRQRVESAHRQRVAIYPAGGSRRERGGGTIRGARGRRRQDPRVGPLRGPQQPAELSGGHAAAAGVAVERIARRTSRASGPDGGRRPPAAAAEGTLR